MQELIDIIREFIKNSKISGAKAFFFERKEDLRKKIFDIIRENNAKNVIFSKEKEIMDLIEGINFDAQKSIEKSDLAVTSSVCGIAETGTLIIRPSVISPSLLSLHPSYHIAILSKEKIFKNFEEFFKNFSFDENSLFFITGPSKTADIEKTVVYGAHGPLALYILII